MQNAIGLNAAPLATPLNVISCQSSHISFSAFSGTDIIKKKLMEQNMNGQPHEDNYDYSHVEMQNHNPHIRSKSLMNRNGDNRPGNLSPTSDQNFGQQTRKTSAHADISYFSVHNPLLSPNLNPSQEAVITSNHTPHNRSPSLKIRRYSFLAGSRRGRGFSELFNSTILNDHFDQYSAQRDDSGLGREFLSPDDRHSRGVHPSDTSPDSGVSEGIEDGRPLPRRRTLPSIVKEGENVTTPNAQTKEQAHSSENLARKNPDTYIIENGIRKRVKGVTRNPTTATRAASKSDLPKEYKIESEKTLARSGKHGSLPDVSAIQKTDQTPMSREEAYRLSSARREELRRLQDLAERRRQGDVTVILGDIRVSDLLLVKTCVVLLLPFCSLTILLPKSRRQIFVCKFTKNV